MSESSHVSLMARLVKAGFPEFPFDNDGFPQPGAVIKYYRRQMIYIDPNDHTEKQWRQIDLAQRLGVSEVTVRLMETQNAGIDSIKRRRLLADILKIPPVLLGLCTLEDFEEFLHHQGALGKALSVSPTLKGSSIDNSTIQLYHDAFSVYNEKQTTSTARESLFEIEQWISRITSDVQLTKGQQQKDLQRLLWDFHILTTEVCSGDLKDWNRAFVHVDIAIDLAHLLNSDELYALSLYRSGDIKLEQRNFQLAKVDLDGALLHAKKINPHLKGLIFVAAGAAHALVDKDVAGKKYAQTLVDQAGTYLASVGASDTYTTRHQYSTARYFIDKADALITVGRPGKALETLDDAENSTHTSETRRLAYIDILRAEAYMNLKVPQLDTATDLLTSAFGTSTTIKSTYNIGYITRLCNNLSKGPYGNSTQVADLSLSLRNWKKTIQL